MKYAAVRCAEGANRREVHEHCDFVCRVRASGFFAGLFGIGGGLIMVPVLLYAFKTTGIAHGTCCGDGTRDVHGCDCFLLRTERLRSLLQGERLGREDPLCCTLGVVGVIISGAIAVRTPAHPRASLIIFVGGFQLLAALLMLTDVSKLVTFQSVAKGGVALGCFSLLFGGVAAMVGIGGGLAGAD